jgi:hypothetical protein
MRKLTFKQLEFINNLEKNFNIQFIEYGFYSNNTIGILCKDIFGLFSITIDENAQYK